MILAALAGLVAWSLAEYLVHRFVLHRRASVFWPEHMKHHKEPLADVGVPLYIAVPLGIGLAFIGGYFFLGAFLGYVAYVTVHEAMHREIWPIKEGHLLYRQKLRHDLHHQGFHANYGVTSPVWDVVFDTYKN